MDRWVGKVAIVTGASAGIGKSAVEKLVEHGMQVVGMARRVERIEEISKSLVGKPGKLHALKCDVGVPDEIRKCFEWTKKNLGPVAVLVNNAGIVRCGSFLDSDPQLWKETIDVNLFGLTVCSQEAIKQMREANIDGHIININSIVGHKVISLMENDKSSNVYSATKYGVTALTEVMRQELRNAGTKIKITSISPGLVDTEIFEAGNYKIIQPEMMPSYPHLNSEDIADAILYTLGTKPHVQIHEIIIKPVGEQF